MANLVTISILLFTLTTISLAQLDEYSPYSKRTKEEISDPEFNSVLKYLLNNLKTKVLRDRRGSVDFGLMSRHLAGSEYAQAAETRQHILNPYGPGKRSRTM